MKSIHQKISLLLLLVSLLTISLVWLDTINHHLKLDMETTLIIKWLLTVLMLFMPLAPFFLTSDNSRAKNRSHSGLLDLSDVLDALSEGIIIVNEQGNINFLNSEAEKITGYKADDCLNVNYSSILNLTTIDNQLLQPNQDPIHISISSNSKATADLLFLKTYSEKTVPIKLLAAPVSSESKDTIVTFRNISDDLDKERDQLEFISTASHEMRTPIAAIDGYLGLALNPKISQIDAKAREYIEKAQNSSRNLGELFKNLLSISKTEDKRLPINQEVIDLNSFLREIKEEYGTLAHDKGLELVVAEQSRQINPDIFVFSDKNLLREVITNLIENAIKYTKQGRIVISLDLKDGNLATIAVNDTGIGIPPEDLPHLFQKFYRVDNTQTREIGGTGLGLYLARRIIENLHGKIEAFSQLGQGSSFVITLPRLDSIKARQLLSQPTPPPTTPQVSHNQFQLPEHRIRSPMSNYHKPQSPSNPQPS